MVCREVWSAKEPTMPPSPSGAPHTDSERLQLLDELAHRVMITRKARLQDWKGLEHEVEEWCWAAIGEALDDLEGLAPADYGATAHERHIRLLNSLREQLDLPPEPPG
jgi:hypothetical protein